MAISIRRFQKLTEAESVQIPEVFGDSCVFQLRPMGSKRKAEWEDAGGLGFEIQGFSEAGQSMSGKQHAVRQMEANRKLAKDIIVGWAGMVGLDDEGNECDVLFSDTNRDIIAEDADLFRPIIHKAQELAGIRERDKEKN